MVCHQASQVSINQCHAVSPRFRLFFIAILAGMRDLSDMPERDDAWVAPQLAHANARIVDNSISNMETK